MRNLIKIAQIRYTIRLKLRKATIEGSLRLKEGLYKLLVIQFSL